MRQRSAAPGSLLAHLPLLLAAALAIITSAPALAAHAETRVALVVGNGGYENTTPLANPTNDATDIAAALEKSGFTVVRAIDVKRRDFDSALRRYTELLSGADVALFFYAGHGLQVGTQNYLVPVDARLARERDLEFEAVSLEFVLRQMEIERDGKTTIVVLDACRDNPLARNLARSMGTRSAGVGRGLAAAATGLGTFIAYATQPGNVALDGTGRNSPFTSALLRHIGKKGRNLNATMIAVRKDVIAATNGQQVPWDHSAMTGEFYFVPGDAAPAQGSVSAAPTGSGADLAALQQRLRQLEDEVRRRESEAGSRGPANTPSGGPPSVTPAPDPNASAQLFDQTDDVRLEGTVIRSFRAPSPDACRNSCGEQSGCIGYQHGRRIPVMGTCVLFSKITTRQEDRRWRSGLRRAARATVYLTPPQLLGVKPSSTVRGFKIFEGAHLIGERIKEAAADSERSCAVVCRNTAGCRAATFLAHENARRGACRVLRTITGVDRGQPATSGLVRTQ